jgi:CRP/FNR family cyclic AMP-dependent transcriptional regulator
MDKRECALLKISKAQMVRMLHQEPPLSDVFVSFLLTRNARVQADLVDQLFNSSEKRVARVLLLLAQFGKESKPETVVPKISQEILAEMIGTTRSRVSFFMNRSENWASLNTTARFGFTTPYSISFCRNKGAGSFQATQI